MRKILILVWTSCLAAVATPSAAADAVLRGADVRILMTRPSGCEVVVALAIAVEGPVDVDHRVRAADGTEVELLAPDAESTSDARLTVIGPTQSLRLPLRRAGLHNYELRYRVTQPERQAYRCPVWLPAVAADGVSRNVHFEIELPPSAVPVGSSIPALDWADGVGRTTLGHLPSLVEVPYGARGERSGMRVPWNIARLTDGAAVAVLLGATALWIWRRRR